MPSNRVISLPRRRSGSGGREGEREKVDQKTTYPRSMTNICGSYFCFFHCEPVYQNPQSKAGSVMAHFSVYFVTRWGSSPTRSPALKLNFVFSALLQFDLRAMMHLEFQGISSQRTDKKSFSSNDSHQVDMLFAEFS